MNVSLPLVYEYITYKLTRNALFRAVFWILNQVKALAMGRPNCAQLACIYMACCEMRNTAVALVTPSVITCGYRDNLYFFIRKCTLITALQAFHYTLRNYYSTPLQFEVMGATLQALDTYTHACEGPLASLQAGLCTDSFTAVA